LGYYFGIAGASMMVLLLLYPLRKKLRILRGFFPVRYWFKAHMLLGILGPVLIIFHSNFGLGSTNSNVALFCMLLVVLSGLVGRYIYRHTHKGLYGKKLDYNELRTKYISIKQQLDEEMYSEEIIGQLQEIEDLASSHDASLIHNFGAVLKVRSLSNQLYRKLRQYGNTQLQSPDGQQFVYGELSQHLKAEVAVLRAMVGLSFYNRLFSLWHIAHLPFFLMMVLTAVVHIVVVHMY